MCQEETLAQVRHRSSQRDLALIACRYTRLVLPHAPEPAGVHPLPHPSLRRRHSSPLRLRRCSLISLLERP